MPWIFLNFGVPGLIGAALGWWLLGPNFKDGKNVLGQDPLSPLVAAMVGGAVIGTAICFLIGVILGYQGMTVK